MRISGWSCGDFLFPHVKKKGRVYEVTAGKTADALQYEMMDMERAILTGDTKEMRQSDTADVMEIMTHFRKEWGMKYPGEIW